MFVQILFYNRENLNLNSDLIFFFFLLRKIGSIFEIKKLTNSDSSPSFNSLSFFFAKTRLVSWKNS